MARALLWLLPGLLVFLLAAGLLAPPALLGRTLLLATIAVVPGVIVLGLVADVRRRRDRTEPGPDAPTRVSPDAPPDPPGES